MIEQDNKEIFKQLIDKGYDLASISFEFDIPVEELEKIMNEKNNNCEMKYNEIQKHSRKSNLQKMREQYFKLFYRKHKNEDTKKHELGEQDSNSVNLLIKEIQDQQENLKNELAGCSAQKAFKILHQLTKLVKKLENYELTFEQMEEILCQLETQEIKRLLAISDNKETIFLKFNDSKKMIAAKELNLINRMQGETDKVEELVELERRITPRVQQINAPLAYSIRSDIDRKIVQKNREATMQKLKNDVPENLLLLADELLGGTFDSEKVEAIIEEETIKRLENAPKNKFSLTRATNKKQILFQIKSITEQKMDEYDLSNPEIMISRLQMLPGIDVEKSIQLVVNSLIKRKEFESAKAVCSKLYNDNITICKILRSNIKREEISDMILRGINTKGTFKEENAYFDLIKNGVKQSGMKLENIILGKDERGVKSITLADIWPEKTKEDEYK